MHFFCTVTSVHEQGLYINELSHKVKIGNIHRKYMLVTHNKSSHPMQVHVLIIYYFLNFGPELYIYISIDSDKLCYNETPIGTFFITNLVSDKQ